MSRHTSNPDWLERNLESTRRRVNQLEIDACRIRTDLARLEVANATNVVDGAAAADIEQPPARTAADQPLDWQPVAGLIPDRMELLAGAWLSAKAPIEAEDSEIVVAAPVLAGESWVSGLISRSRGMYRRTTSPVVASIAGHVAVMIIAVSITVASIEQNDTGPTTTTLVLGEKPSKESESYDPHQLADLGETGVQKGLADLPQLEPLAAVEHESIPIAFEALVSPASPGKIGLSNFHETEKGKVPSGVGGLAKGGKGTGTGSGGGKAGGVPVSPRNSNRLDSTLFFGTQARGNRFVFVVDNSSSMKGGRLEMAVTELVKTVEGLSPKQNFYVIFVSDQTYPMFYPQREPSLVPATPANKKRLADWAPKAILASGKNRELIKAMDLAASLQPQAVYLLWDGDLRYSETVRLDVLTHLTEPNQWKFIVHTLGMGITSPNSEQNLRTIAQAHSGTFRRIDVPAVRTR
jgi:hypothetical protein